MSSFASDEQFAGLIRQEQTGTSLQDQVSRLFEEARDDVYRYLLTLGLYPPQAREAAQEVFLRVCMSRCAKGKRFRTRAPGSSAWRTISASKSAPGSIPRSPSTPELGAPYATQTETPESEFLERERMTRFHAAVAGLSEQQRRCLFLRMEGLRYPEIGTDTAESAPVP